MGKKFDFSGWATRNNIKCMDGRTIRRDAFKNDDGQTVPLVWQHMHNSPENILGHAVLENRADGVYAYCSFNNTPAAQQAKEAVKHGDISSLSIYANQLKQRNGDVLHGTIREVSLVLAGANEGARIDYPTLSHGEDDPYANECVIYNDNGDEHLIHFAEEDSDMYEDYEDYEDEEYEDDEEYESDYEDDEDEENYDDEDLSHSADNPTIEEVVETMDEDQKAALYALLAIAANQGEAVEHSGLEGGNDMPWSAFDNKNDFAEPNTYMLQHSAIHMMPGEELEHDAMDTIIADAKRTGSMRDSYLEHAAEYGIDQIDWLFPEYKNVDGLPPQFIKRDMEWVTTVMNGVHRTPFSRIKSLFADIREDEARAKGYIKGNRKKEEVFSLLRRRTDPQTIYKKQKFDRDDIVDITDFDVIAWVKAEMRMMLNEEIARAILIGDGRLASSEDKIFPEHVRPIWTEDDLFCIHKQVEVANDADEDATAKAFIRAAIKSREDYQGSGSPTLFTTEGFLADMLLLEDGIGHLLYTMETLKQALRVSNIVTVPVMKGARRDVPIGDNQTKNMPLLGIIVNLSDYNVGADKGGAINMFEDFDIDYNQQKYLIETRISGALIKPFSAIVLELNKADS